MLQEFTSQLELITKTGILNKTVEAGDNEQIQVGTQVLILAEGVSNMWMTGGFYIIYDPEDMESCSVDISYVDVIGQ